MRKILTIVLSIIAINVNAQHLMFEGLELGCDFKTLDDHANKMGWEFIDYGYEWIVSYRDVHRNVCPFTLITIRKH